MSAGNLNRHSMSCPGSLLLAGEYLVTGEGGRGLAVAVPPRARMDIRLRPAGPATVESLYAGRTVHWSSDTRSADSLPAAVYRRLKDAGIDRPAVHLTVNTGMFYHSDGRKAGYGSSAAGALLLTAGLAGGQAEESFDVAQTAIEAHRAFQGGRGSGYDVLCSCRGGFGMFTGGRRPSWQALEWPGGIDAWVLSGPAPVSTPGAVSRYEAWKREHPGEYRGFAAGTAAALEEYAAGTGNLADRFMTVLNETGRLGRQLGDRIGIPANPVLPENLAGLAGLAGPAGNRDRNHLAVKCLGAGGELILLAAIRGTLNPPEQEALEQAESQGQVRRLTVDIPGLRREVS